MKTIETEKYVLRTNCKINLYLDVMEKMDDGFHEIITLFNTVFLHDDMEVFFHGGQEDEFEYSYDEDIPYKPKLRWDETNTLFKVWQVFKKRFDLNSGIKIRLAKHIPPQSGLGGSSSDAAALIKLLSDKFALEECEMLEIASSVGSDVPFLLKEGSAIGTEKGDKLQYLDPIPNYDVLLVQPQFTFSTPQMYAQLDLMKFDNWETFEGIEEVTDFEEELLTETIKDEVLNDWEDDEIDAWDPYDDIMRLHENLSSGTPALTFNDFEKAALEIHREYEEFNRQFYSIRSDYIHLKSMTGSGSAHFMIFREGTPEEVFEETEEIFRNMNCWIRRTKLYEEKGEPK